MNLASATQHNPNAWRQSMRRVLLAAAPRAGVIASGPPARAEVCLTFDDGPDPAGTPRVLDALAAAGCPRHVFPAGHRTPMRTVHSSGGSTTKGMKSATIPGRTGGRPRPTLAPWRRRHLARATCCAPWSVWKRTCSGLHTASSHPRSWFGSGHSGRPSSCGASIRVMCSSSLLKLLSGGSKPTRHDPETSSFFTTRPRFCAKVFRTCCH